MKIQENWSIEYEEFNTFLLEKGFIKDDTYSFFKKDELVIFLISLPKRKLGNITLPNTLVILDGKDENVLSFQNILKLRFFRAGG